MSIFKAYDIRGVYGKDITEQVALDIGKSLGTLLKGKNTVCVGHDTRPSSMPLFKNFTLGLCSTGCKVIDLGLISNPTAYFFAMKGKTFGCHITASHNPANWNGFKIIKPNGTSLIEEERELERIFLSKRFITGKGRIVRERRAIKKYGDFLKKRIGKLKCKVVVDFLGGAGTKSIDILRGTGMKVISLHKVSDASLYGFHMLEPWGVLLDSAKKAVKSERADFGVAYDCDADRCIFISPEGHYVDPSIMVGIFSKSILEKRKGGIISTYDCAIEMEGMVKRMGGKFFWSRIGHSFIEKKLLEEGALFAGEESSHYFFGDFYPFSDGLLSTLKLCKLMKERGKSFSELIGEISFKPVEKIYINAKTDERKDRIVEKIRKMHPRSIDISDGFKIILNKEEWVIIRGSQTLPEVNLCIEAKSKERMKELTKKYSSMIRKNL
jgi:phosphomannomutase / phosphoglucomutase